MAILIDEQILTIDSPASKTPLNTNFTNIKNAVNNLCQQTKTYSELSALRSSNLLVAGTQYLLSDYATKYKQPTTNDIKTSTTEPLILTAISNNEFDIYVQSPSFPTDIITYDFDDVTTLGNAGTGVSGTADRTGFITFRKDTVNNNSCYYDFRTILWDISNVDTLTFQEFCTDNTLLSGAFNNTLGAGCIGNTFMQNCIGNRLGMVCQYNIFSKLSSNNILYDTCVNVSFENTSTVNFTAIDQLYNKSYPQWVRQNADGDTILQWYDASNVLQTTVIP